MTPQSECCERNSEEGAAKGRRFLRNSVTPSHTGGVNTQTLTCDVDGSGVLQLRIQTV